MNVLINASNLKAGGGLQVADSICSQLHRFPEHQFVVVLSSYMRNTETRLLERGNMVVVKHDIQNSFATLIFGRDKVLDSLVKEYNVQAVLTVFGPSRWNPRVPHLSGFAMSHCVLPDSPYFTRMRFPKRTKWTLKRWMITFYFGRSTKNFWTETPFISHKLAKLLGTSKVDVHTVSNYYNQVFDLPETWHKHPLESFNGVTCLSVSSYYPHKNFEIMVETAKILEKEHPGFDFRFVLTFDEKKMRVPDDLKKHFVFLCTVDVSECPDLYRQADIMFMPTLLECFTATYPEAMRMEVPIVTTDLEFAKGLCEDAACYYSAVDAKSAAEAIYKVATDKEYSARLVANGKEQLKRFDNYEQRADKLIGVLEGMVR